MATYTKINTLRAHKEGWQESTESGESKSTFSSARQPHSNVLYTSPCYLVSSFRKSFQIIARHFKVIYKTALQPRYILAGTSSSTFGWT
jgi:hypothetical protein